MKMYSPWKKLLLGGSWKNRIRSFQSQRWNCAFLSLQCSCNLRVFTNLCMFPGKTVLKLWNHSHLYCVRWIQHDQSHSNSDQKHTFSHSKSGSSSSGCGSSVTIDSWSIIQNLGSSSRYKSCQFQIMLFYNSNDLVNWIASYSFSRDKFLRPRMVSPTDYLGAKQTLLWSLWACKAYSAKPASW